MATYGEDVKILTGKALFTETIKSKTGNEGIAIADAGAVTINSGASTNSHNINGSLRTRYNSTSAGGFVFNGLESGSTSVMYALGVDTSTNGILSFYSARSDVSNPIEVMSISGAGAAIIGPNSGLTTTHIIRNSSTAGGDMVLSIRKLAVAKNQNNTYYMGFYGSDGEDGYLQTNGSAVLSLVDASDIRKKENIREATYGLKTVLALHPVEFDWISGIKNVKGFIAQEVKEILAESVSIKDNSKNGGFKDDHYLETQTMIPVIVKAIQELAAKVAALEAK